MATIHRWKMAKNSCVLNADRIMTVNVNWTVIEGAWDINLTLVRAPLSHNGFENITIYYITNAIGFFTTNCWAAGSLAY
jgi:hypothetical protein